MLRNGSMKTLNKLSILSYNILAESWFSNNLYDNEIINDLNKHFPINERNKYSKRMKTVKTYLDNLIKTNSYDVICLQETEDYFNKYLFSKYSNNYKICPIYHDNSFWSDYRNPNIQFYPNGITTMIKRDKFKKIDFYDIKLDIGNHTILTKCVDQFDNKFNIINAHLDTEDVSTIDEYKYYNNLNRGKYIELSNIIKILNANKADYNFVIGDLNDGSYGIATQKFLIENNFIDLFKITDNLFNTYPYGYDIKDQKIKTPFQTSDPYTIIDKIFLKTKKKYVCQKTTIYNKYDKVIDSLLYTGSDHYAIDTAIFYKS